jgi:hypothetical protein
MMTINKVVEVGKEVWADVSGGFMTETDGDSKLTSSPPGNPTGDPEPQSVRQRPRRPCQRAPLTGRGYTPKEAWLRLDVTRTRPSANRSSSPGRGLAPFAFVAVIGCCAVHGLIVGGALATAAAWFGIPATLAAATVPLWWVRRRR